RALMRGAYRHALGQVDRRAAAHRDDAVATVLAIEAHGLAPGGFSGGGRGAVEDHRFAAGAQLLQHALDDARGLDAGVGDDQRARDADALAFLRQQPDSAEVDLDLGDVIDEGHLVSMLWDALPA